MSLIPRSSNTDALGRYSARKFKLKASVFNDLETRSKNKKNIFAQNQLPHLLAQASG